MSEDELRAEDAAEVPGPPVFNSARDVINYVAKLAGERIDEGNPEPLMAGTFALYPTVAGGLVGVLHDRDADEPVRKELSPAMIRLAWPMFKMFLRRSGPVGG